MNNPDKILVRGDTWDIICRVYEDYAAGTVKDLTGYTMTAYWKPLLAKYSDSVYHSKVATIGTPANGEGLFSYTKAQTKAIAEGRYHVDIKIATAGDVDVKTVVKRYFIHVQNPTHVI